MLNDLKQHMNVILPKIIKPPSKTLVDLLRDKSVIRGKEAIQKTGKHEGQRGNLRMPLNWNEEIAS